MPEYGAIIRNIVSMLILPAIDILNGRCVRLYKGDYGRSKTYFENPVEVACSFEAAGARWLHIVDLDAARGRGDNNREVIGGIRRAVSCSIEVGGGIRSSKDIKELINLGIDRLIVGTMLARNPELVSGWCAEYPGRLAAGIDALEGMVKVSGWESDSGVEDIDLAVKAAEMGMSAVIYTSIERDGTLQGPDIKRTNLIAEHSALPVILSGGISSPEDAATVYRERSQGVCGLITGKALYEGRIDLAQLIAQYRE